MSDDENPGSESHPAEPTDAEMATVRDIVLKVVALDSQWQEVLCEHEDTFGELIVYLLIGELAAWAEGHVRDSPQKVRRLVEEMETQYQRHVYRIEEAISVTFLEYLSENLEVRRMFTGALAAQAEVVGPRLEELERRTAS